jgi:hypothetical protein
MTTMTMPKKNKRKDKKSKGKGPKMAETADRHVLYQNSVQDVESEIDFVDEIFEKVRGRKATTLREDFCGTANTSCEWVRRRDTNIAHGVDIDPEVLGWGRENNQQNMAGDGANRVRLYEEDVMTASVPRTDIILAMNFSYWLLNTRDLMLSYFKKVRESLVDDGIFFLDAYGGYDAPREIEEERECDGFDYIWDQHSFDPITAMMQCYIHFKFPDKSKMMRAFSYRWRLWTLPEIRELLDEAGFSKTTIYWEGADEEGDGNGEFEAVEVGDADAGWICYIVAEK